MRKIMLSIIALFAIVGVVGMAWSLFVYNDPVEQEDNLSIVLDGYTEVGKLTLDAPEYFVNNVKVNKVGILIDNPTDISKHYASFIVTHEYGIDGALEPVSGFEYSVPVVTLNSELLAEYLEVRVTAVTVLGEIAFQNVTHGKYEVRLAWKDGKAPATADAYRAFRDVFLTATADSSALISVYITVAAK
ncbi:hypothetical protein [Acholeplasma hippikon]|uniref:Uncharacterized protein n=1 Tax=Acholeplasma hippikon TaxID=264636 RepID=A0A449BLD8_9MOLU|nr:hypothetical protein [Acholeplasma hippikon]VEU83242.1 Uncharacterised protein [Acholeplasma hippikon]